MEIAPAAGGQEVKEATLTWEYRLHPRLITKMVVRHDWSTADTFSRGSGVTNQQTQLILGNTVLF